MIHPMKTVRIPKITKTWLPLATVLALSLLGHGFGYDIWQGPSGPAEQMSSEVDYDPKLSDRFFESDEWICPYGGIAFATCRDGNPVLILNDPCDPSVPDTCFDLEEWACPDGCKECATCRKGEPVLKNTARCYSTSFGVKHLVNFCKARLLDRHFIELLFHISSPAFRESLLVRIRKGKFTCQYWIVGGVNTYTWTTTRQELTLDKKVYRKGDVIKGRIDFECLSELKAGYIKKFPELASPPSTIKFFGVFKTTVD